MADRSAGRRRALAVPALVLLAAPLLAACGVEEGPGDGARDVLVGGDTEVTGDQATIQLPHGRLSFTTGDAGPVEEDLPGEEEPSGDYLPLRWEWEPGAGVPSTLSGFLIADQVPAEVSVEVGGESHDVGPAYSTNDEGALAGTRYVPAGADVTAADVTLAVAFDGVTQTVQGDDTARESDVAAPLYELPETGTPADCDVVLTPAAVRGEPVCEAGTVRLPYVTGLGWVSDGQSWLVVDLSVLLRAYRDGNDEITVQRQTERITVDGQQPAATLAEDRQTTSLKTQTVFSVPAGSSATAEFTRRVAPPAPGSGPVAVTGTVTEGG